MSMNKNKIAIGVGSNLGERKKNIENAVISLQNNGFSLERLSSFYETPAVDCVPDTPDFLNAALIGFWQGSPQKLLEVTQKIEIKAGRPEKHRSDMSRILDIDILLFADKCIETTFLRIPHLRLTQRFFVLEPLAEIAGDWLIPDVGHTVEKSLEYLKALN